LMNEAQDQILVSAMPRKQCPKCGGSNLIHQEGCDLCAACGYSKCA
jgi:ribosomal protein S27AE